ncbi:conserved hypothetical protein [Leishmania major strain Friedlin]|uniref:Uncharacterized protein n=1 Tax=Leishmania major TaxID=5664 RepID=E9AFG7_LEIMA|nr:conserved hypothetical protein [Leishmania major strain Friedlin]CAG9582698.1 hypothetical_protein_-_conserved [Leishmania major strain Friedlin]CBZ12971.1 conserved hypothetical protein [Leishmania major strain Friedlin]|eukprot:XP_003722737.1 conserved hypothetical protein [Leishmania major strain Friedlin]
MQLDDWDTYRETLLYARELAVLLPSSWSELSSEQSATKSSSSLSHSSSLPSLAFVKRVEAPLLTQWMTAAAAAPVTCHCSSVGDSVEDMDYATAVVAARWTRMLGMWIVLRVELLCNTSGGVLTLAEEYEVGRYRQYFVPLAWPMLDRSIRERLAARLCALADKRRVSQPMGGTSCANDMAASSFCGTLLGKDEEDEQACDEVCTRAMEATQRVAREQLRISWDALHPSSIPATVGAKLKRLSAQQSRRHESETGSLPRPVVVHTNCLGGLLHALTSFRLRPQRQHADHGSAPLLTLTQNALLHIGYDLLTKVRSSVIERCYYLIPALLDYESCLLFCEAMLKESAALQAHEKELTRTQSILRLTLQSLLQSALGMYRHVIEALLVDYKKSACKSSASSTPRLVKVSAHLLPANPLVAQEAAQKQHASDAVVPSKPPTHPGAADGCSASAVMRLSEPAFSILVEVLEPTCDLLQRYPADWNVLWTRSLTGPDGRDQGATSGSHIAREGGLLSPSSRRQRLVSQQRQRSIAMDVRREVVSFLDAEVSNCFAAAAAGSGAASKKAQQQAAADAYLTATYLSAYGPHWL